MLICVPTYSGTFPQIQVQPVYFNDPKVKAAIHAPAHVEWTECGAVQSVFAAPGDTSPSVSYEVLPRVIARGARTVVVSGLADFVLISEGWGPSLLQRLTMTHAICLTLQYAHCDPKVSFLSISFSLSRAGDLTETFGVSMTCAYHRLRLFDSC